MAFKSKTTRRMPPLTRKVAKLINEMDSIKRRLKNLVPEIQTAELYQRAQQKREAHEAAKLKRAYDDAADKFAHGGGPKTLFQ